MIGWEDYTLVIYLVSKGLPYKDQIEESFIVMVLFYVFQTRNIVSFLINFTFLTAESAVKPQSVIIKIYYPIVLIQNSKGCVLV